MSVDRAHIDDFACHRATNNKGTNKMMNKQITIILFDESSK